MGDQTDKTVGSNVRDTTRPPMKPTTKPLVLPLKNRFNLKANQIKQQQVRRSGGRGR
jgi:hypothetical protein